MPYKTRDLQLLARRLYKLRKAERLGRTYTPRTPEVREQRLQRKLHWRRVQAGQYFTGLLALNSEIVTWSSDDGSSIRHCDRPRCTIKNKIAVGAHLSRSLVAGIEMIATIHGIGSPAVRSFKLLNTDTPL